MNMPPLRACAAIWTPTSRSSPLAMSWFVPLATSRFVPLATSWSHPATTSRFPHLAQSGSVSQVHSPQSTFSQPSPASLCRVHDQLSKSSLPVHVQSAKSSLSVHIQSVKSGFPVRAQLSKSSLSVHIQPAKSSRPACQSMFSQSSPHQTVQAQPVGPHSVSQVQAHSQSDSCQWLPPLVVLLCSGTSTDVQGDLVLFNKD